MYGRFWYEGKSVYVHRWAAKHIHGLDIDQPGTEVDHCCDRPNTLCVQHVQVVPSLVNKALIYARSALEEPEPIAEGSASDVPVDDVPFHEPPEWLRPYLNHGNESPSDDCPF